jgi:hypothetical protein
MKKRGQPKGSTGNPNGRPVGIQNKATLEFKTAVNNLINFATPQMISWLERVALTDPDKALDMVYKFAQFGYPLLARTESTNLNVNAEKLTKEQRDAIYATIKS